MDPKPGDADTPGFWVACHKCSGRFDVLEAPWCTHVAKDRTFVCPHCGSCFCNAPATYKRNLWQQAPPALWDRRFALRREEDDWMNPSPLTAKRPLVLLVEDEREVRAIASQAVLSLGFGLVIARDGQEGLHFARVYAPDIVLSDAFMPKMDGREMCRRIKEDPMTGSPAVIVMTSVYTRVQQKYEALKDFRADHYLNKPLVYDDLQTLLKSLAK